MFGLTSKNKQGLQLQPNLSLLVLPPLNNDAENSHDFTIGIQVNSENHDSVTNQTIKVTNTKTITDLSLELKGFDTLVSISNDLKTISGKVFLKVVRSDSQEGSFEELLEISDAKYSVYPSKAATKKVSAEWDSAKEVQDQINEDWQEEFAFALEDFHECLGNDFANPENSPAPKLKKKPGPSTKGSLASEMFNFSKILTIIAIGAIAVSAITVGLHLYSKNANTQAESSYEMMGSNNPTEQVIIPDQAPNINEAQSLENETLSDFGLEAGVSLDQ